MAGPQTRATIAEFARGLVAASVDLKRATLIERRFRVASLNISVYFRDEALAAAYTARLGLKGAGVIGSHIDHRLFVFHAADLNWPSVPEWADEHCSPRCFHDVLAAEQLKAAYPFSPRIWQIYDPIARIGVQLTGSQSDLPPWDFGAPLRHHLHWLLPQHGLRLTHAATLGRNGRGVLFVGDGGSGKSGTTLAGIAAGMVTCGDDYVATGFKGEPAAGLLFRILKQDPAGLARYAAMRGKTSRLAVNWQGKIELDPEAFFPGCLAEHLAIDAVLLPSITGREQAHIVPISRGESMRALMRSNLYQYPGEDDDGLAFFAKFLERLPCYRIDLALDPRENSETIDRFLQMARP